MSAALSFNEDRHEYRYSGAIVPSVTQILGPLSALEYRGVSAEVMERAAHLGKAVHKLIELDLLGTLDMNSVSDDLMPYYGAWLNFRALSGFEPILSEHRVHSTRYGYAGTLDMFGRLNARKSLIDAKRTAAVPRTAGPQTAGYEIGLREDRPDLLAPNEPCDRYALHLLPEGKWHLVPFRDRNDQRVFLSALNLHTWSKTA